jgi:pilus assembly protein CpaB
LNQILKVPVFVGIALVLGAMAAFMVFSLMRGSQQSGPKVVIVAQPIEAGKAISANQVKAVDWPSSDVPP